MTDTERKTLFNILEQIDDRAPHECFDQDGYETFFWDFWQEKYQELVDLFYEEEE